MRRGNITRVFLSGVLALAGAAAVVGQRPATAADAKEIKLDKAQQDAVNKLRAKGAAVRQIAADTDAMTVNLGIVGKQATDEDVALVKTLPNVQQLVLHNTAVTDAGVAHLSGLTSLTHLHLNKTAITDAALVHLKGLSNLEYLNLYETGVTDEGIKHLAGLKKLRKLYLWQTKVTADGAKALKAAIPEIIVNRGEDYTLPAPTTKPTDVKPAAPLPAVAAEAGKPVNDKCPVSGKDIDPTKTVVYEGKTVAFCCENCPKAFEKDPKKFVAKFPALAAPETPAAPKEKPKGKKADKK
jgi:YHS domain-containing protein